MNVPVTDATGWLLTLEPFGASIGWSLMRNSGSPDLVGVGLIQDGASLRETAHRVQPRVDAGPGDDGRAGLWACALTRADEELHAAVALGTALLPDPLRVALLARRDRDTVDTVTVATRGWLASIPWDILALNDSGTRLIEHSVVVGGLSPTIAATRARSAPSVDRARPGYALIDPGPLAGPTGSLYPNGYPLGLVRQLRDADDDYTPPDEGVTVDGLAHQLHRAPSRLLYLGHVRPGRTDTPAAAALVLRGPTVDTPVMLSARQWLADPARWPSPARVALIGCASDDTATFEQSGLVVAAVNAGAHLVTSTRWPLPTDHPAPQACTPTQPVNHEGLTDLALAVHAAHRQDRPLTHLRTWQLTHLDLWRRTGDLPHCPLLWASTVTHTASSTGDPAR